MAVWSRIRPFVWEKGNKANDVISNDNHSWERFVSKTATNIVHGEKNTTYKLIKHMNESDRRTTNTALIL